jgi:hypothetical protein
MYSFPSKYNMCSKTSPAHHSPGAFESILLLSSVNFLSAHSPDFIVDQVNRSCPWKKNIVKWCAEENLVVNPDASQQEHRKVLVAEDAAPPGPVGTAIQA